MMSYSNGFAVAVRVGGQFVGEKGNGEVHVPFGSVYSLRFKNKHNRFAKVDVRIDGEWVGAWEIAPSGSIDIQRPANRDTAFQFAALDSAAAYAAGKGGDNPERVKGLIEAVFSLEVQQPVVTVSHPWVAPHNPWPHLKPHIWYGNSYTSRSSTNLPAEDCSFDEQEVKTGGGIFMASLGVSASSAPVSDGCTVAGGMTGQQFGVSHRSFEAMGTTIKVFLRGFVSAPAVAVSPMPATSLEAENYQLKAELALRRANKLQADRERNLLEENERLKQELAAIS